MATFGTSSASASGSAPSSLRIVEMGQDAFDRHFQSFIPLPQQLFAVGQAAPIDLFLPRLRRNEEGEFLETVCFLPAGKPLSPAQAQALRKAGMDYYYTDRNLMDQVVSFMGDTVAARLSDPFLPMSSKAHLVYEQASLIVEQAMNSEKLGPNLEQGRAYISTLHRFINRAPEAQKSLAEMLVLDYGLFTHSVNVCLLTTCFASHMGLPEANILELGLGALYHDLGKRTIPERILKKPGALDPDEWALMRQHPQVGFDLLANEENFPQDAKVMVHQHHENLDGTGYPLCLPGEALGPGPRLLRLVDTYDAITAVRVYKGAKNAFQAVQIIMEQMKAQVDMKILRQLVAFLGILNPGPARLGRFGDSDRPSSMPSGARAVISA